ncbi:MAG: M4 family metallopeptidase, partial [Chloroflexota bacterium]
MSVSGTRWQRLLAVIIVLVMVMTSVNFQSALAESKTAENNSALNANLQQQMGQCFGLDAQPATNIYTGKMNFVGIGASQPLMQAEQNLISASPDKAARGYLSECGSFFGVSDQAKDLSVLSQKKIPDGRSVVRFQQTYQGVPVFGGQLLVQLTSNNAVILVNGDILPIAKLNMQPKVDAPSAQQTAMQMVADKYQVAVDSLQTSAPLLSIYSPSLFQEKAAAPALVWRMEVTPRELAPIRELVLLDAHSGTVALSINQLDNIKDRKTYTAGNTLSQPGTLVCNESDPTCSAGTSAGDTDAVKAHLYAGDTYDFYFKYHKRNSINNAGMSLISTVHYDTGYCNAFWNGYQMTYGDGCTHSIVADDVVAHELTHGVTEYESGLVYFQQQGAINESFSDIWGEFVDQVNKHGIDTAAVKWVMGEEVESGGFRNMKDPTIFGDPDRMGSPNYYNGTGDNGGVHWNSGVGNKAAYLITGGATFNGATITGIGITKAAAIYYEAQTNILVPTSNYRSLRNALNTACNTLIGGTQAITA